MAQSDGQTDNHNADGVLIPSSNWGIDVEIDSGFVRENLLEIQKNIAPCKPRIIGVTKYYGQKAILRGYEAGLRNFGESRVADAVTKIESLPGEIRKNSEFHFIGHLQTNKADKAVKYFDYIQSVDSLHLASVISGAAAKYGKTIKVLLQLNNAGEEQKSGYSKEKLKAELPELLKLPNLVICGLMNMAPLGAPGNELRKLFRDVRIFRDSLESGFEIKLPELSMGMSDDYTYAVQEGATMVRIGRKLFT